MHQITECVYRITDWFLCSTTVIYLCLHTWLRSHVRFQLINSLIWKSYSTNCELLKALPEPYSFCLLGDTESQAVLALPAKGWPIRSRGRICLQWLPPQAVHAQRNLPHHVPPCRWVMFSPPSLSSNQLTSTFWALAQRSEFEPSPHPLAWQGKGVAGSLAPNVAQPLSKPRGWHGTCASFDLISPSRPPCQCLSLFSGELH